MGKLFGIIPNHLILFCTVFTLLSVRIDCMYPQSDRIGLEFNVLSTANGFPTNEIQKVYQDREGFMWFATRNGLCKYDGYLMTVYSSNQIRTHLLVSNNMFCLADDNNGNLWIGTDNGVNRFNKMSGKFEPIQVQSTTNKVISSILITKKGDIWIGLDDGLFKYDPRRMPLPIIACKKSEISPSPLQSSLSLKIPPEKYGSAHGITGYTVTLPLKISFTFIRN